MGLTLGVDPGTKELGWVVSWRGELVNGGIVRASRLDKMIEMLHKSPPNMPLSVETLVIERPQIYEVTSTKVDPKKLAMLSIVVGVVAGRVKHEKLLLPYPSEWKGQIPKDVHHRQLEKKLSQPEKACMAKILELVPRSYRHNVWDAAGLCMWALRR